MMAQSLDSLLAEQVTYYRAVAGEYEDHSIPLPGGDELTAALDEFKPSGRVLELACGPGVWFEWEPGERWEDRCLEPGGRA